MSQLKMKTKTLLKIFPVIVVSAIAAVAWSRLQADTSPQTISAPTTHHQLYRVVDGRTIELENGDEVELCGIHALQTDQKLETESTQNLQKLIAAAGGKVIVAEHSRSQNNRIIGEVFVPVPNSQEERLLNYEQVRAGLSYEDKQNSYRCLNESMLAKAQKMAQSERKGIWRN